MLFSYFLGHIWVYISLKTKIELKKHHFSILGLKMNFSYINALLIEKLRYISAAILKIESIFAALVNFELLIDMCLIKSANRLNYLLCKPEMVVFELIDTLICADRRNYCLR